MVNAMEFLHQGIALGIDCLILGICVKEYLGVKKIINCLKSAPQLPIDDGLKEFVASQSDQRVPYAVVCGSVTPIGVPMRSALSPSVTGVVQMIKLCEHRIARGLAGFWTEHSKLIHVSFNDMRFKLSNGGNSVEVIDALSAAVLDMDVVYDHFEPSSLSFFDHFFGFLSGVRQKGLHTTEEVLRCGSFITAVGELELDGNVLRIQPSAKWPLLLTTATKSTLLKKFEEVKSSLVLKIAFCGAVSAVLIGIIVRKLYLKKKQERDERKIRETLEKERRQRRARSRPPYLAQEQLCVVCSTNPKEIIILPCGHVCICEDCSEKIKVTCPICRGKIQSRAAAFIV